MKRPVGSGEWIRRNGRFSGATLALALVAGAACATTAPARQPAPAIPVPEAWSGAATGGATGDAVPAAELAGWWNDFGDPRLDALVREALAANADVLAAAARVRQAEASARIAGADLKPALDAGLLATRRKQNFVGFPIPGSDGDVLSTQYSNFGVSLNLSWEIDLWGRLGARAREGLAGWQASRAEFEAARLSIAGQTAKAWFALAEISMQRDLAISTVNSFRRSVNQTRDRFERGIRPSLDLRLALAQLAAAEAALQGRLQELDATTRQLEALVGRYPDADLQVPGELLPLPAPVPAGLPAELVSRRPDLAVAERRLAASGQRLDAARASLYPRLALTASGGTSTQELGDLVDGNFSVWSLGANLLAPLFQGGRLRAGVDLSAAGVDEATAAYLGLALRAYSEVEATLAAETFIAARVAHLQEAATQSLAAERLADDRYRAGLGDYITVLEAQRRSIEAQAALISSRHQHVANRVDLYLALGGGFDAASLDTQPADEATPSAESHP